MKSSSSKKCWKTETWNHKPEKDSETSLFKCWFTSWTRQANWIWHQILEQTKVATQQTDPRLEISSSNPKKLPKYAVNLEIRGEMSHQTNILAAHVSACFWGLLGCYAPCSHKILITLQRWRQASRNLGVAMTGYIWLWRVLSARASTWKSSIK